MSQIKKSEVIIEHFRNFSINKIGGLAKAMIVTQSRPHVIRYKEALDKYIAEKGYKNIKTLVAVSGIVRNENGIEYTEAAMNGFSEKNLPLKFNEREYRLLVVADKYQTGYDQPSLHSMYVDKRLAGIRAVQTLSRLNRTHPGKEDTFILDFVNDPEDIRKAFQPYYEETLIAENTDPNLLYEIKGKIESFRIFTESEVEEFCDIFKKIINKQIDQGKVNSILDRAVNRFRAENDERREEFKSLILDYLRQYSFLSQLMLFQDINLEKLYGYCRLLSKKLPQRNMSGFNLAEDVALEYYRLQKVSDTNVSLVSNEENPIRGPLSETKISEPKDLAPLKEVIKEINERYGNFEFAEADKLEILKIEEILSSDKTLVQQAKGNSKENFRYTLYEAFDNQVIEIINRNPTLFTEIINNERLRDELKGVMLDRIYDKCNPRYILDRIKDRENPRVELKSSFRYDIKLQRLNPSVLEKVVVKTIAAFMNTEGGTIFIGVDDEGNVLGLQNDYKSLKKQNSDGFEIELRQSIEKFTKNKIANENLKVRFHSIDGKEICEVIVSPAHRPVVVYNEGGKQQEFYVRVGNSSRPYSWDEFYEYSKRRFK